MHHDHDHDLGLAHDLNRLNQQALQRRAALRWLLGAGAAGVAGSGALALAGCGGGGSDASSSSSSGSTGSTGGSSSGGSTGTTSGCSVIPSETEGPYPGDGSNSANGSIANVLALSGVVRSDIRSSIAGATGTATGVPLQVIIELVNTNASCADLSGYAIYLWHCDALGRYSMYSSGVTGENYLRGVQATAADGTATFTTIYPGCYAGRVPHMHFEIYRSTNTATNWNNKLRTSQLCFPSDVNTAVYATSGYGSSAANNNAISLSSDGIFSDGYTTQLCTVTGSVSAGYVATLRVGISA
ncbi:intradiol ring-cleavage dioxygenase [Roseateles asaccharophilus]|uniref:Protocatechuate 3,4-dioxygenase beta subunit n=1 Tax=Roseateles asaccharophilus TaxID=582607 RepID=A0ABU2A703_9BURK|nr:intradiol ring-cleavage dioxygenase [Roseateles asaccharophilus]MDR7332972.1 protocatechuate 3,4-dioxygenase beta subunit [Roseateles asaccharophilus]